MSYEMSLMRLAALAKYFHTPISEIRAMNWIERDILLRLMKFWTDDAER